jgi:hypothetical protein
VPSAPAGDAGSVPREVVQKSLEPADDAGLSRRAVERFLGEGDQRFGMKARGQPLEPHRGDLPIAVAARPTQQIDLPGKAFAESVAQFGKQLRIFPCCCC